MTRGIMILKNVQLLNRIVTKYKQSSTLKQSNCSKLLRKCYKLQENHSLCWL